jgi:hypothetical protein
MQHIEKCALEEIDTAGTGIAFLGMVRNSGPYEDCIFQFTLPLQFALFANFAVRK